MSRLHREILLRLLLVASLWGLVILVHAPTHVVSAVSRWIGQAAWIDHVKLDLPAHSATWLAPAVLALVLVWRNQGQPVKTPIAPLRQQDIALAALIALTALGVRLWPLLHEPWIKPDYDEGVYLGAAWLLRSGVLPYRDYVLPHLPGSLLLLWPAGTAITLWQDNSFALLLARGTAALSDGLAVGLLYLAARHVAGMPGALFGAVVYGSDVLASDFSRGVRLEPLQAPWLVAGAWLTLRTLNGRRCGFAAGCCFAVGVAIKLSGAVSPMAAMATLLLERRWKAVYDLACGLVLGVIVLCGWCVLTSGDEIVRQALLLQWQRPLGATWDWWGWILSDRWVGLTAMATLVGAGALCGQAWSHRVASGWLFSWLWLGCSCLLFGLSPIFYDHYYAALVPPLALVAAAWPPLRTTSRWATRSTAGVAPLLVSLWAGQAALWGVVDRAPAQQQEGAALLALPPERTVLSFNPLAHILAGRPLPHAPGGPYLLDTYLGDAYLDSPLNGRWPRTRAVEAAVVQTTDYILGTRAETGDLRGLEQHFVWQPITRDGELLLFTRVDRPADILQVGPDLELLRRNAGWVEEAAGQTWIVQPLHWRARQTPPADLALALHLVNGVGERVAQLDVSVNGGATWAPGSIMTLHYRMPVAPSLAAGQYQLRLLVYAWSDGRPLPLHAEDGGTTTTVLDLPPVVIGTAK